MFFFFFIDIGNYKYIYIYFFFSHFLRIGNRLVIVIINIIITNDYYDIIIYFLIFDKSYP